MNKLFKILLLAVAAFTCSTLKTEAQTSMTLPNGLALDTASQAAAERAYLQVKDFQSTISLHVPVTKISGTIAGSIKWQGSNDGGNTWYTLQTDTLTDATNVYGYTEAPKKWLMYGALITQTGTSSLSYKGKVYATKQ